MLSCLPLITHSFGGGSRNGNVGHRPLWCCSAGMVQTGKIQFRTVPDPISNTGIFMDSFARQASFDGSQEVLRLRSAFGFHLSLSKASVFER